MVAVRWLCSPSLLPDIVDELESLELFATLISTTLFSSGPDSELTLLDMEEQEDEAGVASFFFLVFLMTPVLHLDFRGCL